MTTKNLVVKIQNLIVNHESRPVKSNAVKGRVGKVNLFIHREIVEGFLPFRLIDGFIYSINVGFYKIPDKTLSGLGCTTLRLALANVI